MEGSDNTIKVSSKVRPGVYINEGKEKLKAFGTVAFHAMGNSITSAIKAADRLVSLGYGSIKKFETQRIETTDKEGGDKNVCKVILELKKSDNFEKISQEFEKTRQARE
ncbi:unnamed protein product [Blepharisma stoltei]|uniref:DNA/RNA-binding protein Alba-like domain-containing protein n=1 Tax=Blepharisma stoltei TaxID=1481888 RepID=A0AAU9J7V1_9CILI|nr:unnamed protein product [Blepharisma stoltei]|mmetsp:Transcript_10415/g.10406  ORF Transcript_10415/g.10406 Transcript_10415/m.10406 type:complete len:109 (+) Transcript_10415:34-360(+)